MTGLREQVSLVSDQIPDRELMHSSVFPRQTEACVSLLSIITASCTIEMEIIFPPVLDVRTTLKSFQMTLTKVAAGVVSAENSPSQTAELATASDLRLSTGLEVEARYSARTCPAAARTRPRMR